MSSRPATQSTPLSQLWQMPLMLGSLGLFGYATFLLWNPTAGPTIDQQLDAVQTLLAAERPEAAVERLNGLVKLDKLSPPQKSRLHLMMAEGVEQYQDAKKLIVPALQTRIVEQTRRAQEAGGVLDGPAFRRAARAQERLGQTNEALQNYKKASALDPAHAMRLQRKVIELELDSGDATAADEELKEYLKTAGLADHEKCWALGTRAQVLSDQQQYVEAKMLLGQALRLSGNSLQEGEINYRSGYVSYQLGQLDDAERSLRVARELLRGRDPVDADACLLLGKIAQDKDQPEQAETFFKTILTDFPQAKCLPQARLGRAVCLAKRQQDDAAVEQLTALTEEAADPAKPAAFKNDVLAALRQVGGWMASRDNSKGAIDLMTAEQTLSPNPGAEFFGRLTDVLEQRATQIEATVAAATPAERIKREQQARNYRTRAGDAAVAFSQKQTVTSDQGYADALWRGIGLYERAGNVPAATSALELFVAERPEDPMTPDAVLRLGQAYQASGQFDKAVTAYQKNQQRYAKSLAATKSAVPLAMAYVAKGPEFYGQAETTLLSVLEDNDQVDPSSEEFRRALFELGQLYYRMGRYEQAVVRLDDYAKRYPNDERGGHVTFLTADSYRKSAATLTSSQAAARRERLDKAAAGYGRVVDLYREKAPQTEQAKLDDKMAHFNWADCLYDNGDYEKAIKLYDNAAFRFQDDPSALAAYVQIVNACCRLGKMDQAKAANERAKWVLRRIPPESFTNGSFSMPKEYWEQWLKWVNDSGMW